MIGEFKLRVIEFKIPRYMWYWNDPVHCKLPIFDNRVSLFFKQIKVKCKTLEWSGQFNDNVIKLRPVQFGVSFPIYYHTTQVICLNQIHSFSLLIAPSGSFRSLNWGYFPAAPIMPFSAPSCSLISSKT